MRYGRQGLHLCWCAVFLAGCDDSPGEPFLPNVSSADGVEVARLATMPLALGDSLQWALEPRREVLSSDPADPLLYDPSHVLVLRDGRLLVYDEEAPAPLALLDPESGQLLTRFGRLGRGPGEIGGRVSLGQTREDGFEVLDGENGQVHRYDLAGRWLASERVTMAGWPVAASIAPNARGFLLQILMGEAGAWWHELVGVSPGSQTVSSFARLPTPSRDAEPGYLQKGRPLWAVVGRSVVTMWSDRPSIEVHDQDGMARRRIELPLTRRDLTERDVAHQVARVGALASSLRPGSAALTNMLYPLSDTVFGMFVSNLWRAEEDPVLPEEAIYWRLLTLHGEYLGFVRQPADFRFLGLGSGSIWARLLDERLEPRLVEFELVNTEDSS